MKIAKRMKITLNNGTTKILEWKMMKIKMIVQTWSN
jgi:hypothetical protein